MDDFSLIQRIVVWSLPVIFAITVHEVAHGWVAKQLGDPTAMMMGRLTLNPIKHIDPIGTIVVPLVLLVLGGFIFGWAKPVPVTWENLRKPKRDMALVAIAGSAANLIMAILWALVIKFSILVSGTLDWLAAPLFAIGQAGILINVILMVLNLLSLPPLDGGRVATGLLPGPLSWKFSRIEPYGFFILLGLLATGLLGKILWPPVEMIIAAIQLIFRF